MPELPEVETVVRGLQGDIVGRVFGKVSLSWPRQIVTPSPHEFAARLPGQRVHELGRRGKFIVFQLTHDALLIHLKMTGRLYVARNSEPSIPEDRWVRVVFGLDNGHELRFSDVRKFGRLYLVGQVDEVTRLLGPEPLSDDFTPEAFKELVNRRERAIKALLLDQHLIAGIGNIYADEALWEARIDPRRKANTLSEKEIHNLHTAIRLVLQKGIDYEGASINWYRKADGSKGQSQNHLNVYSQESNPCMRCGTSLIKIWFGQRGTHFCPTCQI
jgi:formamidopyrimidine-DNA glycosylase